MNFSFTEEQDALRSSVRRFLDDKSPETEVRRLMDTVEGYDRTVWSQMADQLGLQGLIIPEEHGGSGSGYVELTVALEEMGRSLFCAPFFSTVVLATNALLVSGDDKGQERYLPSIASGEIVATVALTEEDGKLGEQFISLESSGGTLTGTKSFVLDGHIADLIIVPARTPKGITLYAVDGKAPGLVRTPLTTFDQTRKQAKLQFDRVPGEVIGEVGRGWNILSKTLDLAAVGLAAEQVGGAQRALEMSVEYAKNRVQFGKLIGSFQAIKHRCAEVFMSVESARSAAYYAALVASEDSPELPVVASFAKAYCSDAYFYAAAENIQIHGGIGFTWDYPAHLYFKRGKTSELLLGDASYHRQLVAERLGI